MEVKNYCCLVFFSLYILLMSCYEFYNIAKAMFKFCFSQVAKGIIFYVFSRILIIIDFCIVYMMIVVLRWSSCQKNFRRLFLPFLKGYILERSY